ncbi:hypothetical protein Tco_1037652 [Tanacetum coccineum]
MQVTKPLGADMASPILSVHPLNDWKSNLGSHLISHGLPAWQSLIETLCASFESVSSTDKSKITRKQSKNEQARTRESEEYKKNQEPMRSRESPKTAVKSNHHGQQQ